jgi:dTDP-4-amino-4,6-dideoxygalactose transaminase
LIDRLCDYLGVANWQVHTVSNATLGLQGALMTVANRTQLKWGVPSWTFTATAAACEMAQVDYSFLDVDDEWRIVPKNACNAIVDVLPFGADLDLERFSRDIDYLVIDAAASFDSLRGLNLTSDIPIGIVVSLHATKLLPAGEGGFFVTNDKEWASKFKAWTNFGMSGSRVSKFIGTNAKLSEYGSAVALASLDSWPSDREEILQRSKRALNISHRFALKPFFPIAKGLATPYWILQFESSQIKTKVEEGFKKDNISTRAWWENGCHAMPAYSHIKKENLINTEFAAKTSLGLPFHNFLQESDWNQIENSLHHSLQ